MPRPIRERDLVLERIKVATDAATRALSTLFAVGAVVVVVVVGGVARVAVRATATATGTATAVITIATVIAIGRATATRTIIVTGVASITVIAIVEVTVGRTTATRTIIIAIIAIEVAVIGATATRTVVVIILEVIGATATRTVVTIVEVTVIALGATATAATAIVTVTTATAATAVIAIATARAGVVLLILETRNGQGDLAAIIDTLNDHLNGVAFLEHVFDSVNTLAVGQVADLGDVQQAVGAGGKVHESAERRGLDDLAVVGFAGLGHVRVGNLVDDGLGLLSSLATLGGDEDGTVILDGNFSAGVFLNLVDHLALRADDFADLLNRDGGGDDARSELAHLGRAVDALVDDLENRGASFLGLLQSGGQNVSGDAVELGVELQEIGRASCRERVCLYV